MNEIKLNSGRIASSWWGQKWCQNIDMYSDTHSRLERGRVYLRRGTIKEIGFKNNKVYAFVQGSDKSPYKVEIEFSKIKSDKYNKILKKLTNKIENINQLCSGSFPEELSEVLTATDSGIFPKLDEIRFGCSCPDVAIMCKHIAAVLYGIGNLIDNNPLIIFQLRGIDLDEFLNNILIEKSNTYLSNANSVKTTKKLIDENEENISELFGIDLELNGLSNENQANINKEKDSNNDKLYKDEVLLNSPSTIVNDKNLNIVRKMEYPNINDYSTKENNPKIMVKNEIVNEETPKNMIEKYNSSFTDKSRERGMNYYINNKVQNLNINNNKYSCIVDGTKKYHVSIEFDNNSLETINDSLCECCFYDDEDNCCKHIYAVLCKIFNVPKVKIENKYSLNEYKNMSKKEIIQKFLEGKLDIDDIDELGYDYLTINDDTEIIDTIEETTDDNLKYKISELDWIFKEKIRKKGLSLYSDNKVGTITRTGNVYSANVSGKKDYQVSIEYSDIKKNNLDHYSCECAYYEEEGEGCEHIYALICASFKLPKKKQNIIENDNNLNKMSKKEIINKIKNGELDLSDIESINYEYKELFPEENINDPLIKFLDNYIAGLPMEVLKKAYEDDVKNGKDNPIIEKAIKTKEERIKLQELERKREEKRNRRFLINAFWSGLFGSIIGSEKSKNNSDLTDYEQSEIDKGNYEPYQFEESELEDDDYYNDDLD